MPVCSVHLMALMAAPSGKIPTLSRGQRGSEGFDALLKQVQIKVKLFIFHAITPVIKNVATIKRKEKRKM